MGLDQSIYVYKKVGEKEEGQIDLFERKEYYFRKVNCLQGFMERKYDTKNCISHTVWREDIEKLHEIASYIKQHKDDIQYIKSNLPPYPGCFFGRYEIDGYYFEDIDYIYEVTNEILNEVENISEIQYHCWY